jgi:hypothetical protein
MRDDAAVAMEIAVCRREPIRHGMDTSRRATGRPVALAMKTLTSPVYDPVHEHAGRYVILLAIMSAPGGTGRAAPKEGSGYDPERTIGSQSCRDAQ